VRARCSAHTRRAAGWLQPLLGSSAESQVLTVMQEVCGVVNVSKAVRRKRSWRDALLQATLEVQSVCHSLAQTEVAQSALQHHWIQKIVDSPYLPQQLHHWGSFVLSPGTVETIHEDQPMSAGQLQMGSEHFDAPAAVDAQSDPGLTNAADCDALGPIRRTSSAPSELGGPMRRTSSKGDLCHLK
jgi:hypothetical protein